MWLRSSSLGKLAIYSVGYQLIFAVTILRYEYGHQGQGRLKVKVITESNCRYFDFYFYFEVGGAPSAEYTEYWVQKTLLFDLPLVKLIHDTDVEIP